MNFWTVVFLIVVVGCITSVMTERYKALGKKPESSSGDDKLAERDKAEAEREVAELRERIKVLERIATDANSAAGRETKAIAEEIERLRDK